MIPVSIVFIPEYDYAEFVIMNPSGQFFSDRNTAANSKSNESAIRKSNNTGMIS